LKQCLTSKGNRERYSTALRKITSTVLFKRGKKTMGSLYTFPRRLFWRRWEPKLSTLSLHVFFYLVRELPDSTSGTRASNCVPIKTKTVNLSHLQCTLNRGSL
jgi:hypothetical protein